MLLVEVVLRIGVPPVDEYRGRSLLEKTMMAMVLALHPSETRTALQQEGSEEVHSFGGRSRGLQAGFDLYPWN